MPTSVTTEYWVCVQPNWRVIGPEDADREQVHRGDAGGEAEYDPSIPRRACPAGSGASTRVAMPSAIAGTTNARIRWRDAAEGEAERAGEQQHGDDQKRRSEMQLGLDIRRTVSESRHDAKTGLAGRGLAARRRGAARIPTAQDAYAARETRDGAP